MPSTYAHYRFGCQALPQLPEPVQTIIKKYRRLYDFGVHGPDPFFYYLPGISNKVGKLGSVFHALSGEEFFGRCARRLRLNPSEAAMAYLYGVLSHYCLDSFCHPSIEAWRATGKAGHAEIETEFDRFLLEADGKSPAKYQDLSPHMRVTRKECAMMAPFYAPVTENEMYQSALRMYHLTHLLALPEGPGKTCFNAGVRLVGGTGREMLMTADPNPRCAEWDEPLLALYRDALAAFPDMVSQFNGLVSHHIPLNDRFALPFG